MGEMENSPNFSTRSSSPLLSVDMSSRKLKQPSISSKKRCLTWIKKLALLVALLLRRQRSPRLISAGKSGQGFSMLPNHLRSKSKISSLRLSKEKNQPLLLKLKPQMKKGREMFDDTWSYRLVYFSLYVIALLCFRL